MDDDGEDPPQRACRLAVGDLTVEPFKRLTVEFHFNALTKQRVQVAWVMEPAFDAPGPWTFTLERAHAASADDWRSLAETVDQPWLFDNNPELAQHDRATFYRVRLVDGDGKVHISQPVSTQNTWGHYDWRLMKEILRKESMLQRKKTGARGVLLKRKLWGDPCTTCVDPNTSSVLNPHCPDCFGTSFVGGYHAPLEYWLTLDPSQRMKRLQGDGGVVTAVFETARALAWPNPEGNDVWVQLDTNRRFRIGDDIAAIGRHRGVDLLLQLHLEELPQSNVVYQVPTR